nr:DUF3108 domain-containing protein [Caldimonas mangrovi]
MTVAALGWAASSGAAPPELAPTPVYSTRLPPAFTWTYALQRGALSGTGELSWRPLASTYQLKLEGKVVVIGAVLTQVSRGRTDPTGLAPQRFTDRRLRRAEQAAVFDRAAGKITFTGRSTQRPLVPGVQDRLSWMVQLPAIAQADPDRVRAGAAVVLRVVGARGNLDVWTLRSQGLQTVQLEGRTVQAVKLTREPDDPDDTVAEIWLDPQRHHLPVRARLTDGRSDPLELLLQSGTSRP